ncbi:MAG TPA: hypothetical protein VLV83_12760 [Acidobacteriota bacterium]|nr:hypothetical protein [Acidobacteriota bacterium]
MAPLRFSSFLWMAVLAFCVVSVGLAQISTSAPTQTLTAPQVVNNQGISTQIVLLNTASTACQFSARAHVGAGNAPPNPVNLGGSEPNLLQGTIPGQGTAMFDVIAPMGFLGAVSVDIDTRACQDNVQMEARYAISNLTPLDELFSYSASSLLPIPLNSCAEIPVKYDPDPTDGDSSIPGVASVFPGNIPLQGDLCHSLRDADGQEIQPQTCLPYDGRHQPNLLSEIFPTQTEFNGVWRICVPDAQGATNPPGSEVEFLFIDVVQDGSRVQFGTKDHERVKPACPTTSTDLCLDDRFRVNVDWRPSPSEPLRPAQGVMRNDDGFFFFFNPDNVELVVKVLDGGCPLTDHFWVFYGATTNVEYTITVVDTETDLRQVYTNPVGTLAEAITDTSAFATCP